VGGGGGRVGQKRSFNAYDFVSVKHALFVNTLEPFVPVRLSLIPTLKKMLPPTNLDFMEMAKQLGHF
jgi:hypothetical protein